MRNIIIELNTQVSSFNELNYDALEPFSAVYLGNPYCRKFEDNLLENLGELKQAVASVQDMGKKAYVSTYAAPGSEELPDVMKIVEAALSAGADAIEAHNLGVIRLIAREFPGTQVHSGGLANVYTSYGAMHLAGMGVKRVAPHYELSLDEIKNIKESAGVEVEILVHGKMPLGITRECFLLTLPDPLPCPAACREAHWLKSRDWVLKSAGTVMLSGKDVCMMEHLPFLLDGGYRAFRVEAAFENNEYRKIAGTAYARAIRGYLEESKEEMAALSALNENGFCNGYYFGRSGRDYVECGRCAG